MVPEDESSHLSAAVDVTTEDVWDAAWDGDEENAKSSDEEIVRSRDGSPPKLRRHRSSFDEERAAKISPLPLPADIEDNSDEVAEAWGWGDDEAADAPNPELTPANSPPSSQPVANNNREVTIVEKYWTSSMPQPVLEIVIKIYEDASTLTQEK
jgi:centromere/kinetochore protein ZW10